MASGELPRRVVSGGNRLTPDEVSNRSFASARRGYAESEVRAFLRRVADDLGTAREREADLASRIARLEEELRNPPPVTEQQLLDALGEETARVLRSAQQAAEDIRSRAEERSSQLLHDAQETARKVRDEAHTMLAERRREAEEAASSLRAEAEMRANELVHEAESRAVELREGAERFAADLRARVEEEAGQELEGARARGREMLDEARKVRERVLTDLARRRAALQQQLEELRAGRDRLVESYRVVQRTLGEATRALTGAPDEVELAPEAVAELSGEGEAGEEPAVATVEIGSAAVEVASIEVGELDPGGPGPGPAEAEAASGDETEPAGGEPAVDATGDDPPTSTGRRAKGPLRSVAQYFGLAADEAHGEPVPTEEAGPASGGGEGAVGPEARARRRDAGDVFARLREREAQPAPNGNGTTAPGAADEVESRADTADDHEGVAEEPTGDAALVAARDDAVRGPRRAGARALKRALQDEQNDVLDALRRAKRKTPSTEDLLGSTADALARWSDAVRGPADDVYRAASGGEAAAPDVLVTELAEVLVQSLRGRLGAIEGDPDAAATRAAARYREWRTQDLDAKLDEVLATAYSRAVYDRAPEGAVLRWVQAEGAACPDCDDNALEPVRRGADFPTGQPYPPAHPGCRCLLVVAGDREDATSST